MFISHANYFTVLHINNAIVSRNFSGLPFAEILQLTYPNSMNEELVANARNEVLERVKAINGVSIVRIPNSLHYAHESTAVELESYIMERNDIMYNGSMAGSIIACAEGQMFSTFETIQ